MNKKKIFVTGLTSTNKGGIQYHNLGNYIIVDVLFQKLRETFPDHVISTSIQLSDDFYKKFNIKHLRDKRFFTYGMRTAYKTLCDIFRIFLWKITKAKFFLSSTFLLELESSDLIIDFSGDIYGDNAKWHKFLETNARLWFALMLRKKIAMIIGSPGPFSSFWRVWIAKYILPRLSLITNREPLSTEMLTYIGVKGNHIYSTACPSVMFKPCSEEKLKTFEDYSMIFKNKKPTIGIIISGWNMPVGPYNRWPRDDSEFKFLIQLINHLKESTNYRICLMSHQNNTAHDNSLIKGNDHRIIDKLIDLLGNVFDGDRVFTLKGLYDAAQSKAIIGKFDLVISGRIHGAVQALSQCIPTVIIDYGHEPKAHKLKGFASVYNISNYIADPNNSNHLCKIVDELIANQEFLKRSLISRLPSIKNDAEINFKLLKNLY